jgi:hypothetical protein
MAAHETGSSGRRPAWSTSAGHLTIHFLNRPVRTRMPGGVAGDVGAYPTPLCRFHHVRVARMYLTRKYATAMIDDAALHSADR